jgi:hypothetical protein
MSIQAQLKALKDQYKQVEADLADALLHPSSSFEEIVALRQKKLVLKDEIAAVEERLRSSFA